jgi:hypothetical protein
VDSLSRAGVSEFRTDGRDSSQSVDGFDGDPTNVDAEPGRSHEPRDGGRASPVSALTRPRGR